MLDILSSLQAHLVMTVQGYQSLDDINLGSNYVGMKPDRSPGWYWGF